MIQEILVNEDKEIEILTYRAVAVDDYGSEGCMPLRRTDCPVKNDVVACVSGSGDSICSGYFGHAGNHVIRCLERLK